MPAKMAQISPLGRRSGCQDYGRRPRRQAVLSKRGNSAKIHPGLGFIWGIPDYIFNFHSSSDSHNALPHVPRGAA